MFKTLTSRILVLIVSMLIITTASITYYVQKLTYNQLSTSYEQNARNMVKTVYRSVESKYQSVQFHRDSMLERRKIELNNVVNIAVDLVNEIYLKYKRGEITERQAKAEAINVVRKMRYDKGVGYIWINDTGRPIPRMIMHPTIPELDGNIMDDEKYNCAMGIKKNLFVAFVDVCTMDEDGYVDYLWPKPTPQGLTTDQPKLSYVKLFKPWGWILGSGVYIDDIENEAQKRKLAIVEELRQVFTKTKIGETGYMYIFNSDKKLLIHPNLAGQDGSNLRNPETQRFILEELMLASKVTGNVMEYKWDRPMDRSNYTYRKKAFIYYFEPLDWYIGSSIYLDEIAQQVLILQRRVFLIAGALLIVSFAFSIFLSKTIIRPLSELIIAAKQVSKEGVFSSSMPVVGSQETKELGAILEKMLHTIRDSVRDLKDERNFSMNIIKSTSAVICGIRPDGITTFINPAGEKITGYSSEEIVGRNWWDVFYPREEHKQVEELMEKFKDGDVINHEMILTTKNGSKRVISWNSSNLFNADGSIKEIVGLGNDMTDVKKSQELMIQTEKMMSVGGLAAGMAHEINNPLASVLQGVQNTLRRLSPEMESNMEAAAEVGVDLNSVRKYMEKRSIDLFLNGIHESGIRAAEIVKNMLNFSRQSETKLKLESINSIIDETLDLASHDYDLKKNYDFKRIEIEKAYAQNVDVECVKSEIEQVLLNIFKNGAEIMNDKLLSMSSEDAIAGGSYIPKFVIRTYKKNGFVCVEVEDNGPGMSEDVAKRVFEPFYTTKRVGKGTGLGLSVSYFIIKQNHKGNMWVESKVGLGAKFVVELPC